MEAGAEVASVTQYTRYAGKRDSGLWRGEPPYINSMNDSGAWCGLASAEVARRKTERESSHGGG